MASAAFPVPERSSGAGAGLDYRADIDGLRAIAVLPVVLFHAGVSGMRGGYVGVDIFFVISGYLITRIIWRELQESRFSIVDFYERRVRRILPALAVMLAAVLAASAFFFLPRDFARVPASVAATLGFVSNILFYTQTSYFDPSPGVKPLLHTWSLAVEEQYYLFFPVFMALAWRWVKRVLVPALAAMALLSFLMSAWGAYHAPTFTFYMAPTRVWELFAGSLLAVGFFPDVRRPGLREMLCAAGLLLILLAIFAYDEDTPFPGLAALLPVAGSLLIIRCGRGTAVGGLLARPPLVFVGLISYSLYLWHWPVIVFSQYWLGRPLDAFEALAAVFVSLVAAALSWRFVEQPFRSRRRFGRRSIFGLAAAAAAALALAAAAAAAAGGWPSRFGREGLRLEAYADDVSPRREECQRSRRHVIPLDRSCTYGANVAPTFAMWGDSHGVELVEALGPLARRHGVSIAQFTFAGCGPMLSVSRSRARSCVPFNRSVLQYLLRHPQLRTVILVIHADGDEFRRNPRFGEDFVATAELLARAGRSVVIVHPIPSQGLPVPGFLALLAERDGDLAAAGTRLDEYRHRNRLFLDRLDRLGSGRFIHVRPADALCRSGVCIVYRAGHPIYSDDDHLSMHGARILAPLFAPIFS